MTKYRFVNPDFAHIKILSVSENTHRNSNYELVLACFDVLLGLKRRAYSNFHETGSDVVDRYRIAPTNLTYNEEDYL